MIVNPKKINCTQAIFRAIEELDYSGVDTHLNKLLNARKKLNIRMIERTHEVGRLERETFWEVVSVIPKLRIFKMFRKEKSLWIRRLWLLKPLT